MSGNALMWLKENCYRLINGGPVFLSTQTINEKCEQKATRVVC
jgi:hypothetical protein